MVLDQPLYFRRVEDPKDRPEDRPLGDPAAEEGRFRRRGAATDRLGAAGEVRVEPAEDRAAQTVRDIETSKQRHVVDGVERR